MTAIQIENRDAFCDPLPASDTLDRMEEAIRARRREMIVVQTKKMQVEMFDNRFTDMEAQGADRRNEIVNRMNQASLRQAGIEREIVEVARLIVAEADNAEIINLAAGDMDTE